VLAGRQKGKC